MATERRRCCRHQWLQSEALDCSELCLNQCRQTQFDLKRLDNNCCSHADSAPSKRNRTTNDMCYIVESFAQVRFTWSTCCVQGEQLITTGIGKHGTVRSPGQVIGHAWINHAWFVRTVQLSDYDTMSIDILVGQVRVNNNDNNNIDCNIAVSGICRVCRPTVFKNWIDHNRLWVESSFQL